MLRNLILATLILASLLSSGYQKKESICLIKGNVVDRNSDKIILLKARNINLLQPGDGEGPDRTIIPIKNNSFECKLIITEPEAYLLVFGDDLMRGIFKPIYIFPETGKIECTLYSNEEFEKNDIKGGTLNLNYRMFQKLSNGMSPDERSIYRTDFIRKDTSIISYFLFYDDITSKRFNGSPVEIEELYKRFANKYPDHSYTQLLKEIINSTTEIKIGGRFIDFEAPDLNGKLIRFSEIIKGKFVLLDLWASYCGPCIITNRSMIPIYNEFKDRGFTIIGVAGELNNTDQLKLILDKEKFPWTNLVDLNKRYRIWNKYGVTNSAGGLFLIDNFGKILCINPTSEQVKKILFENLK